MCPKCGTRYDGDLKICRRCGSILEWEASDQQTDEVEEQSNSEESVALDATEEKPWHCPKCHESVPGDFTVCWNCGTTKAGESDPDFHAVEDAAQPAAVGDEKVPMVETAIRCIQCGSSKVVPGARIVDQGKGSDGNLQVVIYGVPEALIFKDRLYGTLVANICGECGHVALRVENAAALYDHYRYSKE